MAAPESRRSTYRILAEVQVFFLLAVAVAIGQTEQTHTGESRYRVEVGAIDECVRGGAFDLPIELHAIDPQSGLSGFDFTFSYNDRALLFQRAYAGDLMAACGWEYFTYLNGPSANQGGHRVTGMVRLVGIADVFTPLAVPGCTESGTGYVRADQLPVSLAYLSFKVSDNCDYACTFQPVRFYWTGCGDNLLTNHDGAESYLSQAVYDLVDYDYDGDEEPVPVFRDLTGENVAFPTLAGAPHDCVDEDGLSGVVVRRNVEFFGGGLGIVCADRRCDTRGDINLDGTPYEMGDLVTFANYFTDGLAALPQHNLDWSIQNSDVNADRRELGLADLQLLVQVIVGNGEPVENGLKVRADNAAPAIISRRGGVLVSDRELGAAHLVIAGQEQPQLLTDVEMRVGFDGLNTRVLLFDPQGLHGFEGEFLRISSDIVSAEFVTVDGRPVAAKVLPRTISLQQNYPNPFNPSTTIAFEIPGGGSWELKIFNIAGQLVDRFSGVSEFGDESVEWSAANLSTGVYFYRLQVGDNALTRKAVFLK
jgi:hypothetical protein